jgi:hypothetical protein
VSEPHDDDNGGRLLAPPLRPRKTPTFTSQQQNIRVRVLRGDTDAKHLDEQIAIAIAAIAENPCAGYRMRGLPVLEALCAYHLPKPLRRWRVIYRLTRPDVVELLLIGEHWRTVAGSKGIARPSGLSSRLRFEDIYDSVASFHGGGSKEERKRIRKAVSREEKERCCRSQN